MNIRVALDVSVLGNYFGRLDSKIGVARVAEELLFELSATKDIELTAVALTGDDPLLDSVQSLMYTRSAAAHAQFAFARSFATRLRLGALYQAAFTSCLVDETSRARNHSVRPLFWREYVVSSTA